MHRFLRFLLLATACLASTTAGTALASPAPAQAAPAPASPGTALPAEIHDALVDAAAKGDDALIEAVKDAVKDNPKLSQLIVADATEINPALAGEILDAAVAPAVGPGIGLWPIVAGVSGAGAAGAAVGAGGGGGGGDSGSSTTGPDTTTVPPGDTVTSEYDAQAGLALVNAADAYARGLSGKNVIIGVLDTGLDVTHPEFAGQVAAGGYDFVADTSTMSDPHGHGTHVSGIIAARKDDVGMHGIAYDAKILPIRILDADGFGTLTNAQMASAIDLAVAGGAVVINNSWGSSVPVTATTRAQIEADIGPEVDAWGRALDNSTVVVFAAGNDGAAQPAARPGLPYHYPEYEGHWIAVIAVNLNGNLTGYTNACGVAAAWCIAAPGGGGGSAGVYSTLPVSQGSYGRLSGTSMAAPHVSGAIAVLMELFPELTPDQIVARLFATANKSGAYGNTAVFGQGLLDLEKATRPVGGTVVATGDTVNGAVQPLETTGIQLGAAFGDGLLRSLQGVKLAVFDADRATFVVDLAPFVQANNNATDMSALLDRYGRVPERYSLGEDAYVTLRMTSDGGEAALNPESRQDDGQRIEEFSFVTALDPSSSARVSYNQHPALAFGLQRAGVVNRSLILTDDAFSAPYLSLAAHGYSFAASHDVAGLGTLRVGSFSGSPDETSSDESFGTLTELAVPLEGRSSLSLQLGFVSESETVLGSRTSGAFDTGSTPTYFGGLATEIGLTDRISLVSSYFAGLSVPTPAANSLFTSISPLLSDAASLGVIAHDTLAADDRMGLVLNQPLRVMRGSAELSLATGRDRDGTLYTETVDANLAPAGRERDIEVFYDLPLGESTSLSTSAMQRIDPGHVRDAEDEGVSMIHLSHVF